MLDHSRAQFENPWLWPPAVALGLGVIDRPNRGDIAIYIIAMVLLLITGAVGFLLHIQFDLTAQNVIVPQRFLHGAPFLAPMLFANMELVGLISIMNPVEANWQPVRSKEPAQAVVAEAG